MRVPEVEKFIRFTIIDPIQKLTEKRNEEAGMRTCLILYFRHIDDLNTLY